MRDASADRKGMAERRERMLTAAYQLFKERSITAVSLEEIAKEAGCGKKTLLRYFDSKAELVVAVSVREWADFMQENRKRRPSSDFSGMTALEIYEFFLDSFLEMYRNNRDLLRFNQLFNVYILSEGVGDKAMKSYNMLVSGLSNRFHIIYEKAAKDHTVRTDIPEQEMFITSIHLMLAAVTRYAVGLVYTPDSVSAPEKELEVLKEALLLKYGAK